MNPLILMGLIVAVPALLIVLSGTKAALVFMALCVGSVLSTLVGDTALDMVQLFTRSYSQGTLAGVKIGLLMLPAFLTILFLSRTLAGSKKITNIFPALLTGLMALFLTVPFLPDNAMEGVYSTDVWNQLAQYQPIIVSVAVLLTLGQLWAGGASLRHRNKRKHG